MALYDITLGGSTVIQAEYTDPTAERSKGGVRLSITSAKYNNSTNKLELGYSVVLYPPEQYNRTDLTAVYAVIAGTEVCFLHPSSGTLVSYTDSDYRAGSKTMATGTVEIAANKGTTQSISLYIKGMFYYGWTDTRWNANTGCSANSGSATAPVPGDPSVSVSITSKTSASRGGSTGKATATAVIAAGTNGGSISSYSVTNNGSSTTSAYTKEATGLKNNTSYSYSATATNSFGLSGSASGSYYLTPVAPALSVTASPARTGCTLNLSPTFDTNRKLGSYAIRYGTSVSYGSTTSSGAISGLTPNTTYYYSATVTDSNNGGPYASALTSGAATGSFRTTGNAPSITGVSVAVDKFNASLSVSVTCDTNASVASYSVQYGTTSSYGSTSSSTALSGLTPSTLYYYRVQVTDTEGRTSSWSSGTFTTLDDQAKGWYKTANGWVRGKVWVKTASGWTKAKKVFTKTDSGWRSNA